MTASIPTGPQAEQELDLLAPELYAHGIPHQLFQRLRDARLEPLFSTTRNVTYWPVVHHDDVARLSRDTAGFSSEKRGTILGLPDEFLPESPALTHMDPPRHGPLRRSIHPFFAARSLQDLEPRVREVARTLVSEALAAGAVDFADDIAAALPRDIIGGVLGVPPEDRERLGRLGELSNSSEDPELFPEVERQRPWQELGAYAHEMAAARVREPQEDLITALLNADVEGRTMTVREFAMMFRLLVVAGNETTRDALCSGLVALLERPEEVSRLQDDPSLAATATDEILRWATPVRYFSRTVMEKQEFRDRTLEVGDQVALFFASANFDPAVFDDPLRFDVGRKPNRHVTFGGGGPHVCLGAALARLEMRILLEELIPHLHRIELDGPPARLHSHINHGYKRMPIRFT